MTSPLVHKLRPWHGTVCGLTTNPESLSRKFAASTTDVDDEVTCRRCLRSVGFHGLTTAAIVDWIARLIEGIDVRQRLLERLRNELTLRAVESLPVSATHWRM